MDHLDRPACPRHPQIEIPILYTEEFQGQDFGKYRHEMGWTRDDISGGVNCTNTKSLDERAAFLQTRLFFGLLRVIFNNRFEFEALFQISDYIKNNDMGRKIVTLANLQGKLQERDFETSAGLRANKKRLRELIRKCNHVRGQCYHKIFDNNLKVCLF